MPSNIVKNHSVTATQMTIASVVMASALGLLASGCTGGDSSARSAPAAPKPTSTVLPQILSKPNMDPIPEPLPSPATDATFSENLAYELRRKTVRMANAEGKTDGRCPKGLKPDQGTRATCTINYEGLNVVWDETIGDKSGFSDNVIEFDAVPRTGVLTRDGVARLLYGNYRDGIDHARCTDIPKASLVPLNAKTKYACEVVFKGEEPGGMTEPVRVTDSGPRVY
ncbi:hypothetical protein [Streptomyces sp. NPDC088141]|uniref:hypothetical protein n=1 Tax=Streptomyces sp. NPDC088141 TaxID=3155179 RepID=UPI003419E183